MSKPFAACYSGAACTRYVSHGFILGYVPTNSMKPTLEAGSLILGVRIKGSFEVGDVVIFCHGGNLLSSVLQRLVGMWSCITESTCLYPKAPTTCWETMRMTPMIPVTGTNHLYQ